MTTLQLAWSVSLIFAMCGVGTLILDENPARELKRRLSYSRDRSRVKPRLAELNRGDLAAYEEFRFMQFTYTTTCSLIAFALFMILSRDLGVAVTIVCVLAVTIYFGYDRALTRKIEKQRTAIEDEFPAIVEMLTLAISAGESPLTAFARITENSSGYLSRKFEHVLQKVNRGTPFTAALDDMGREINLAIVSKFVDSLVNAITRGAPIAEVLMRNAQEAREFQRNRVLSAAGKAEISMMIPVVFLILPISILFALWPSLTNLNLFAS